MSVGQAGAAATQRRRRNRRGQGERLREDLIAAAAGLAHVRLAPGGAHRVNPLDPPPGQCTPEVLVRARTAVVAALAGGGLWFWYARRGDALTHGIGSGLRLWSSGA